MMRTRTGTALILATWPRGGKVTMVLGLERRSPRMFGLMTIGLILWLLATAAFAATTGPAPECPQTTSGLYERLRSVGLDGERVYHVRDASIDRANLHIDLDDGTLAFTEDICGRITGAVFEGEGEIRLRPPDSVERASLALFTSMAMLEEQFSSGYFRFNDDTAAALQGFLRPASDSAEFINTWSENSRAQAEFDSLRLLEDFSHFLPMANTNEHEPRFPSFLHVHLVGKRLGGFEVFWDGAIAEPLWAGQPREKDGMLYFDIWTSFAPRGAGRAASLLADDVSITNFRIQAWVQPPRQVRASTELKIRVRNGGERALLFELSRYLKIEGIESDGRAVDFIQNPAIEGTELRRKGNDLVAVVFAAPLAAGQEMNLHFRYAGEVLSDAGNGLLYVGERGTWYPNFGLSPAQFDLEFHYPANWTLVATGKPVSRASSEEGENSAEAVGEKVSRWSSERPIPVAGFNLGKYVRAGAKAGSILVEVYGTKGVEKTFPKAPAQTNDFPSGGTRRSRLQEGVGTAPPPMPPPLPSPARDAQAVAEKTAKAIERYSQWFGPFPYGSLALTQLPGSLSQGWPGLVFLSSFAFLSPQEQSDLRFDPMTEELNNLVLAHETAHQWWGDLVQWQSYRDQWLTEGLANYAALLLLEQKSPAQFRQILEKYRRDLLSKNKDGEWLRDSGPVTLGQRLESSHFPHGYEEISYERGTWLFHMLRSMLREASFEKTAHESETESRSRKGRLSAGVSSEEPFFRALRKIRERYAGKKITTEELIHGFEEELPRPLWYEHRHNLDWFLESWVQGTAIPELETRDIRIAESAGATTVTGMIVQKDAPDDLVTAVPVYGTTAGNALVFLGIVLADGAQTSFRLSAPSDVRKILLDPKQTVLTAPK